MWKQKIGISMGNHYGLPSVDVVKMLKQIGYDAISLEWEREMDFDPIVDTARACGMLIHSLHAPYGKISHLWSRDERVYAEAKKEVLASVECCAKYEIPLLVCHAWIGFGYSFHGEDLYFQNFDDVVGKASALGVRIAFENTEGLEYLRALMEHYKDNCQVGFCWDSGHEMCYNHSEDLLAEYGSRLLVTHINDNLGISNYDGRIDWLDDLHLLPYDGAADWAYNVQRLKKSAPLDVLNFELNICSKPNRHENDVYAQMSLEQFFLEAYKRARRLAYMLHDRL